MSFAMPKVGADVSELGRLYANLSNGMHTMAQPLTVLRSAVAACAMPGLTEEARQFYLNVSSEQVERACAQFLSMQELLSATQNPAACVPIDLSELLAFLGESQKEICGESGVGIEIVASETLQPIHGRQRENLAIACGRAQNCGISFKIWRYGCIAGYLSYEHHCVDCPEQAHSQQEPEFIGASQPVGRRDQLFAARTAAMS